MRDTGRLRERAGVRERREEMRNGERIKWL